MPQLQQTSRSPCWPSGSRRPAPPDVDVGGPSPHGCAGNEAPLHQLVGVMAHDLTVLAGAWLRLICVDHQI